MCFCLSSTCMKGIHCWSIGKKMTQPYILYYIVTTYYRKSWLCMVIPVERKCEAFHVWTEHPAISCSKKKTTLSFHIWAINLKGTLFWIFDDVCCGLHPGFINIHIRYIYWLAYISLLSQFASSLAIAPFVRSSCYCIVVYVFVCRWLRSCWHVCFIVA